MKLIKRCYGCGKRVWPWQNTLHTKLVGKIHKECAFNASIKYPLEKAIVEFTQRLDEKALKQLNDEVEE